MPRGLVAILAVKEKHGSEKPEQDIQGEMPCPLCGKGKLRYSISSYNGHVWAACTNKCVAVMQ